VPDGARLALALDIGGTKTTAALVDATPSRARVLTARTAPTPARAGASAVLGCAVELGARLRGELPRDSQVRAVGIAAAGVVDADRGVITHATEALPGWPGTDLAAAFRARFGVPVRVLNDVHAHGVGESRFGVGRGSSSLLLVAVGTGIGGCHVLAGRAVTGTRGAAGHLGHVVVPEADGVLCSCGRRGHLEGLASGPGILALARRLGADDASTVDGPSLAAAARAGSAPAGRAYEIAGRATGRVIGGLLNVLDPEVVALTGGVVGVGGAWRSALLDGIAEQAMDVVARTPVRDAAAGVHAALLGAAATAIDAAG